MQPQHGAEVDLGEDVTVEHHHRLGELISRYRMAPPVPSGIGSTTYPMPQTQSFAFADDFLDAARLVVQAEDDLVDLRNLTQQIDLIVEKGPVQNRDDRLGRVHRERTQSRALAAGEQNGFHDNPRSYHLE